MFDTTEMTLAGLTLSVALVALTVAVLTGRSRIPVAARVPLLFWLIVLVVLVTVQIGADRALPDHFV